MKKFILFLTIVLGMVVSSCSIVDSGEAGIKFKKFSLTDQGQLDAVPASGFVFYNIFTEAVYKYPVYVQRVDYKPFTVTTKDAAVFSMDPMLAYQIERSKAKDIFAKYRRPLADIETGYIRTCIYDAYRITANSYTSDELMANRAEFETKVRKMLDETLGEEGFIISEFTSQIVPPQSLQATIDSKNQAIQESIKALNLVKKAEADAKIAVAKAEGEAKALKVKADAEAYYNRQIAASLSTLIVQQNWIEKWSGKLPEVQAGNGMMPVINLK